MARIPDERDLGRRPTAGPARGIPNTAVAGRGRQRAANAVTRAAEAPGAAAQAAQAAQAFADADVRIRTRDNAVERARVVASYNEEMGGELRRLQSEEDLSQRDVAGNYIKGLADRAAEMVSQHGGSDDSKAQLAVRLEGIRSHYANQTADLRLQAQDVVVQNTMGGALRGLTASAYGSPGQLSDLFATLDAQIDDMAPALTPEQELDFRTRGRSEIAASALESFLDRGQFREAQALLSQTPGITEVLSPEKQRQLMGRITELQQAQRNGYLEGQAKLDELRTILGRAPTPDERARFAGVAAPAGGQTLSDKIAETEAALDRPLTAGERERMAGLEAPEPTEATSPQGKIVQDRQMFITEYGEGSPQVAAFDELAMNPNAPPSLSDVGGQRREFTKLSGVFVDTRDSFNRIAASRDNPSPAGDLALMFNYMKMLDPGSVVRESEFATVAATGSFGQRLEAAAQRFLEGERLSDDMRADFAERAEMLMQQTVNTQVLLERQYGDLAVRSGIDPANVVIDFLGPFRPGGALTESVKTQSTPVTRYRVDLEGNIISGGQ